MKRRLLLMAVLVVILAHPTHAAVAAGPRTSEQETTVDAGCLRHCYVTGQVGGNDGDTPTLSHSDTSSSSRPSNDSRGRAREAGLNWADTPAAGTHYGICSGLTTAAEDVGTCGAGPTDPAGPTTPAVVPAVTPGQAGAIAAARLKIPTVAPGIGPSPDLNRWKMAAVGYPLWLWADGPTEVGPVSDSVAGLSVSLSAEVTSLTFRMGDGTTVTCAGVGNEWTKAVEPGTKAPGCGHTYTKPSLPKGNYKVTARTEWAVTWTANGQSGVINVPSVQSAELPVGELQVLVR